jgi:hypothetical protein
LLSSQVKYGPILLENTSISISVTASCAILSGFRMVAFKVCVNFEVNYRVCKVYYML